MYILWLYLTPAMICLLYFNCTLTSKQKKSKITAKIQLTCYCSASLNSCERAGTVQLLQQG